MYSVKVYKLIIEISSSYKRHWSNPNLIEIKKYLKIFFLQLATKISNF